MAQHGYLGDGYGTHGEIDPDRDDDRERSRRDRGFMFEARDRMRGPMHGEDRPHSSDADEWFGGREPRGFEYGRPPSRPSSRQDDHYRSWRDRQIEALDRDYADYCREREQQFHRDFDDWRSIRQNGARQTEPGSASEGELILGAREAATGETTASQAAAQAKAAATLGTNTSQNTARGRR